MSSTVNTSPTTNENRSLGKFDLASGHFVVIFSVTLSVLVFMFLVNRWRALRRRKRNKSLKKYRNMTVTTNKHFPKEAKKAICTRFDITLAQSREFDLSVPLGAAQYGWGDPGERKWQRFKKKIGHTAQALEKIFARDAEHVQPRGHQESIVEYGTRISQMERYRDLASVLKLYVEKYEKARFSSAEMSQGSLDQVHNYLQHMHSTVSAKLKLDLANAYARGIGGQIHRPSVWGASRAPRWAGASNSVGVDASFDESGGTAESHHGVMGEAPRPSQGANSTASIAADDYSSIDRPLDAEHIEVELSELASPGRNASWQGHNTHLNDRRADL